MGQSLSPKATRGAASLLAREGVPPEKERGKKSQAVHYMKDTAARTVRGKGKSDERSPGYRGER